MENVKKAIQHLNRNMSELDQRSPIPFDEFLKVLAEQPFIVLRDVFQVFHDMIKTYIGVGADEYPDDPESINFVKYDCNRLFVEGSDHPFFADRLFANRLINLVEALRRSTQQNKIYIFEGPPGCGKSTFLNNLLMKFEEYANKEDGSRFETVWRLDRKTLGGFIEHEAMPLFEKLSQFLQMPAQDGNEFVKGRDPAHLSQNHNEFINDCCLSPVKWGLCRDLLPQP